MATKSTLTELTISRRTAIGMALAAATLSGRLAIPRNAFVAAEDAGPGTWNWEGNAGHTGELPGPGLNLNGTLGELWRASGDDFGLITGYLNGVIYTASGGDDYYYFANITARNLSDGTLLWTLNASNVAATPEARVTPATHGTPTTDVDQVFFSSRVAIDNDILLVSLSNGQLWALDAMTGDLRWDFDSESDYFADPTVADHTAYIGVSGGVCALEIGDGAEIRWKTNFEGYVCGVDEGLVYVVTATSGNPEIRALTTDEGHEFWRFSLDELGDVDTVFGASQGNVIIQNEDYELQSEWLSAIDRDGQLAWSVPDNGYNTWHKWVLNGTITRMTPTQSVYDYCRFQSLFTENGQSLWDIEVNAERWPYTVNSDPVLCAGIAYALVRDAYEDHLVLLAVDPTNQTVFGSRDSRFEPLWISDSVMLAQDYDTDEILAIGTVSAVLQVGGRANVTKDSTLRGAPGDAAVGREELAEGTLVEVTGESETSTDITWYPVTVLDTDSSGWLPADVLEGMDGDIRFSPIDISEFGLLTTYPKFSAGTRAEVTEKVDMRGAPSESSAKKSTLEAGTLVTVTSPPTTADDVEWCPIIVDDTGDNGWVPTSVLQLISFAMG